MARYQYTRMESFRNAKVKPVARCTGCGYYEHTSRIERDRCRSCADIKAGKYAASPDLAAIKAA